MQVRKSKQVSFKLQLFDKSIVTDFRTKCNKKFGRGGKMYQKYILLRDSRHLTDYRVSQDTGITKSTFTDWKKGRSNPKLEKLKILADYFGVTVDYFLNDATEQITVSGKKSTKIDKWEREDDAIANYNR